MKRIKGIIAAVEKIIKFYRFFKVLQVIAVFLEWRSGSYDTNYFN